MKKNNNILRVACVGNASSDSELPLRIRTSFIDSKGRAIFIELSGVLNNQYLPPKMKALAYKFVGFVNEIEILVDGELKSIGVDLLPIRGELFNYTIEGILSFINYRFGTAFNELDNTVTGSVFSEKKILS